jgi:ABC-2 type transport system ATP-binding protein
VLLSSHILPEVEASCQRTIIIASGKIVASGSPGELKERIRGGSRLIAEVSGPTAEVKKAVSEVDGVSKVEAESDNGWQRLTIETKQHRDLREDIFKVIKNKGWSLRELRLEVGSLEEFFVQITARQMQDQPAGRREVRS